MMQEKQLNTKFQTHAVRPQNRRYVRLSARPAPFTSNMEDIPISKTEAKLLFVDAFGKSSKKFYDEIVEGLPEHTKLNIELHLKDKNTIRSVNISIHYDHSDNGSFLYRRSLNLIEKNAYHNGASTTGPIAKRYNANKKIQARFFELYKSLGIEKIRIGAGAIGCYAWQRLGFICNDETWMKIREKIKNRIDFLQEHPCPKQGPLPEEYIHFLKSVIDSDNPKGFWAIVDQAYPYYGRTLGTLLSLSNIEHWKEHNLFHIHSKDEDKKKEYTIHGWSGEFDMTDPDCIDRINHYLRDTLKHSLTPVIPKKNADIEHNRTLKPANSQP